MNERMYERPRGTGTELVRASRGLRYVQNFPKRRAYSGWAVFAQPMQKELDGILRVKKSGYE